MYIHFWRETCKNTVPAKTNKLRYGTYKPKSLVYRRNMHFWRRIRQYSTVRHFQCKYKIRSYPRERNFLRECVVSDGVLRSSAIAKIVSAVNNCVRSSDYRDNIIFIGNAYLVKRLATITQLHTIQYTRPRSLSL